MQTGTYHSFSERLYAIKTHFLCIFIAFGLKLVPIPKTHFKNLRIQILFYCWEKQVCPTDLRQEVGNTRLTRAIIFAKLLLVVCKKEKPTGNTFRGEDKCITKKKKPKRFCFLQSSSCCFQTDRNTQKWWGLDGIQQSKVRETNSRTAGANSLAGSNVCTCKYSGSMYMHLSGHGSYTTHTCYEFHPWPCQCLNILGHHCRGVLEHMAGATQVSGQPIVGHIWMEKCSLLLWHN